MRKKQRKRKQRQWPNVYRRKHRGGHISFVVDLGLINGKRERHSFKTKEDAEDFAEHKRVQLKNEGLAGLTLSQELRLDAAKAAALLSPYGVPLFDVARYYVKHVLAYKSAPPLADIVQRLIADAHKNDRRDRTIGELKSRLESFAEDFPDTRLIELTVEEIEDWLDQEEWSPRTRINYLTKISQLYNYALRHKWVDANLAERIERPTAEDKEPGIFTIPQAKSLLKHAPQHGLLAYISIGLFAGLRSAELMRLEWSAVNLKEKAIIVGVQVAKKRSRRVVEICDALAAWLKLCHQPNGPIADEENFRDNMDLLKAAAGITDWPHNGLRHSYGSYHLAAFGNQVKTAAQMGHRDSNIIHNHYKALVLKSEAEKYWKLTPAAVEKDKVKAPQQEQTPNQEPVEAAAPEIASTVQQ